MPREPKTKGRRWIWWWLLGIAVLALVTASAAMAALQVRRFAITDPQFQFSRDNKDALQIEGLRYASRARVLREFVPDFGHSIFALPLELRRRRLLDIDWVENASISRLWPDRLVVRIQERTPVAFVSFPWGVRLIDAYGVVLEPPLQARFTFPVLSGVEPRDNLQQRRERVQAFLRVENDLGSRTKDISEVNAADPENILVVAQVEGRTLELLLGDSDFGARYQNFLNHYPEIRKRSPEAKHFDLRLEDRITAEE